MVHKVCKLGIEREPAFVYYVRENAVWRVARAPGAGRQRGVKIAETQAKIETGYVYFLDVAGDVSRVKLASGRARRSPAG